MFQYSIVRTNSTLGYSLIPDNSHNCMLFHWLRCMDNSHVCVFLVRIVRATQYHISTFFTLWWSFLLVPVVIPQLTASVEPRCRLPPLPNLPLSFLTFLWKQEQRLMYSPKSNFYSLPKITYVVEGIKSRSIVIQTIVSESTFRWGWWCALISYQNYITTLFNMTSPLVDKATHQG